MPTQAQEHQAKLRIHKALDRGEKPSPVDVETIGGEEALQSLLDSRSELKETVEKLTREARQEAKEEMVQRQEVREEVKSGRAFSTSDTEGKEEPPKKMTREEKDYYEFTHDRLGPLMCLFIFFFVRDWEKASFYALSPEETSKLAGPMSKLGPRIESLFHTPKWVHVAVTASDDAVTVLFVLAGYLERTGILDKLFPIFSKAAQQTVGKYAKGSSQNHVQPTPDTGPISEPEYSNGYSRQAIDARTVYRVGSQWSADI